MTGMISSAVLKAILAASFLLVSACSSTGVQTSSSTRTVIDSRSGPTTTSSSSITFGSGLFVNSALLGSWTMADRFARRCTYAFKSTALAGTNGFAEATPSGYCTSEFQHVAGWRSMGREIILTDADGNRLVELRPDGTGGYAGTFRGGLLGTHQVVMRRGRL